MAYTLQTDIPFSETRIALLDTFRIWNKDLSLWGTKAMIPDIEVNTRRYDQEFYGDPESRRVTIRWTHPKEGEKVVSCDKFMRVRDNLRAIYLTIESIRMGEKRVGTDVYSTIVRQVVGLIEAPKGVRDPWVVMGLRPGASVELIDAAYRALANQRHPDKGGSAAAFAELTEARDTLKQRLGAA